jgi:acetyl esterase/lipase
MGFWRIFLGFIHEMTSITRRNHSNDDDDDIDNLDLDNLNLGQRSPPLPSLCYTMSRLRDHSFAVNWRKALVSAPRLVPDSLVLRYTSPLGPHPITLKIPCRTKGRTIPVACFLPPTSSLKPGAKDLPIVVDFHGGSMILGTTQEQAPFCAQLSRELGAIVISVDYALGPYEQFPAANHDCEDIIYSILNPVRPGHKELRKGILDHLAKEGRPPLGIDTTHIAISGFSSGGNLALELVLDLQPPTVPQPWPSPFPSDHPHTIPVLLYYPSLDARQLPDERPLPEGMPAPAKKSILKKLELETQLMPTYLPRDKAMHPRASPGLAPISAIHPKAEMLLYLCQYDTLSTQSQIWINRVKEGKRDAALRIVTAMGVPHGFNIFPDPMLKEEDRKLKRESYDLAVSFIREKWGMAVVQ